MARKHWRNWFSYLKYEQASRCPSGEKVRICGSILKKPLGHLGKDTLSRVFESQTSTPGGLAPNQVQLQ